MTLELLANLLPHTLRVVLPLKINANLRGHWRALAAKTAAQRQGARVVISAHREKSACLSHLAIGGRLVVVLTRVAPRQLDSHDNLRTAFKPIADGITDALGLPNDRHPRVAWKYHQMRGAPRAYSVEISITRSQ